MVPHQFENWILSGNVKRPNLMFHFLPYDESRSLVPGLWQTPDNVEPRRSILMFDPALQLVRDYPLAAITGVSAYPGLPVHVPLIARTEGDPERIISFIGHMAKRNVSLQALQKPQEVGLLFCGPEGYITPNLVTDRSWIPTWNYARLFISGQITFSPELTQSSLEILIQEMEQTEPLPWSMEEAGSRTEKLKEHIIGFHVENLAFHPMFKLGQDEKDDIFSQIIQNHDNRTLTEWMKKFRTPSI